jgi:hypothetical protein
MSIENAKYIEVSAGVRYWEDATVNGIEDTDGKIPLRRGANWEPVINLSTGAVKDWPVGTTATVHYKVCDAGEYWLQDEDGKRIAKWRGYYVPDDYLCVGSRGYGDYIIFKISADGAVEGWRNPGVDVDEWEPIGAQVAEPAHNEIGDGNG